MAKMTINGQAFVITSELTADMVKNLQKFSPSSLVVKNEKKEPVFDVSYNLGGRGSIGTRGITFNSTTAEGNLQLTVSLDPTDNPNKSIEAVKDNYGLALISLKAAETEIKKAYDAVAKDIADICGEIESI